MTFGAGGPLLVQYWNSHEKLYHYASDRSAAHRPAWAAFNRRARKAPGAVGIWHETFLVRAGEYETIYSGVPPRGLGLAGHLVPAIGKRESARARINLRERATF